MTYQRLLSYTRKAVDDYQMIQEGDRIAVGISGGKDSITLALALKGLQRFYPKHFEVMAFTCLLYTSCRSSGNVPAFPKPSGQNRCAVWIYIGKKMDR